jgi:hypothetical protein
MRAYYTPKKNTKHPKYVGFTDAKPVDFYRIGATGQKKAGENRIQ